MGIGNYINNNREYSFWNVNLSRKAVLKRECSKLNYFVENFLLIVG